MKTFTFKLSGNIKVTWQFCLYDGQQTIEWLKREVLKNLNHIDHHAKFNIDDPVLIGESEENEPRLDDRNELLQTFIDRFYERIANWSVGETNELIDLTFDLKHELENHHFVNPLTVKMDDVVE